MSLSVENLTPTIHEFLENEKEYTDLINKTEDWSKIPLLKHNKIQLNGSLLRFRGMIQDMLAQEHFLESCEVTTRHSERILDGRFRDVLHVDENTEEIDFYSRNTKHGDRIPLFLVTIPGINQWADESYEEVQKLPEVEKLSVNPGKRTEEEEKEKVQKRQKVGEEPQATGSILSPSYLVNSPLPDRPSRACIVKIYKDFHSYRLNTIIDVVGFLSIDAILDGSTEDVDEMFSPEEHIVRNPPPSLIPRLHAVATRTVLQVYPSKEILMEINFQDISRDILMMLTQCLFGDELAGRYLFAHLLSSIQSRVGGEILGKMCLNLTNLPNSKYTKSLYGILETILPVTHRLEMTLENLNELQFIPKKDYKTNKLTSGILQLAPKTHLILDETCLEAGQLQSSGIEGVQSLSHLIRNQMVEADFQFYRVDYEADVAVLILGEGKSLLPSDILVPLQPDPKAKEHIEETFKAAMQFIRMRLDGIRHFLAAQKLAHFELNEDIQATVQDDLVTLRKAHNASPEELHSIMTLSRLVGKSLGKDKLDLETWKLVQKMDKERRERIKK